MTKIRNKIYLCVPIEQPTIFYLIDYPGVLSVIIIFFSNCSSGQTGNDLTLKYNLKNGQSSQLLRQLKDTGENIAYSSRKTSVYYQD